MSLLRRRMMMQEQAENKAKYPFVNGRHDFLMALMLKLQMEIMCT